MRVRRFSTEFWPGDIAYLRVAPEKEPGMVQGVAVTLGGSVVVTVGWGDASSTDHYEAELSAEYVPDYARDDDGDGHGDDHAETPA